ncbi:MAG: response regulator [Candidatus Omnitrophota bacterium]
MKKNVPQRKTIVLVEDDNQSAADIKTFLEKQEFSVVHACDGEIAIETIKQIKPDLVILDIIMPKIDGFTVAKKIHFDETIKNTPIIVFSAQEGMKDLFALEGINDYMVKPIELKELLSKVRKRLGL